jgi:hypothetical protein
MKRGFERCQMATRHSAHSGEQFLRFLANKRQMLLFVSLFLIVIGSRAVVINYGGNPTPFTDEWDGEGANLLKPYLQGTLTIGDLFHTHNEHVIFLPDCLLWQSSTSPVIGTWSCK